MLRTDLAEQLPNWLTDAIVQNRTAVDLVPIEISTHSEHHPVCPSPPPLPSLSLHLLERTQLSPTELLNHMTLLSPPANLSPPLLRSTHTTPPPESNAANHANETAHCAKGRQEEPPPSLQHLTVPLWSPRFKIGIGISTPTLTASCVVKSTTLGSGKETMQVVCGPLHK